MLDIKLKNNCITAYPLYDWNFSDIWRYIYDNKVRYNKIYDWMWKKGMPLQEIRVSSLIHEKSFKAIVELPEFEPKTYNRLLKRLKGISLETYPDKEKKEIFKKRFAKHLENNYVARQQVRQLVLNDYENNLPVDNKPDPREATIKKWMELL